MFKSFSPNLLQTVAFAQEEAASLGSVMVAPRHLLFGLIRLSNDNAAAILRKRGVTLPAALRGMLPENKTNLEQELPFTEESKNVLKTAYEESEKAQRAECTTEHMILALLKERDVQDILEKLNVSITEVQNEAKNLSETGKPAFERENLKEKIATWHNRAMMAQQQGNSDLLAQALEKEKKYETLLKNLDD